VKAKWIALISLVVPFALGALIFWGTGPTSADRIETVLQEKHNALVACANTGQKKGGPALRPYVSRLKTIDVSACPGDFREAD